MQLRECGALAFRNSNAAARPRSNPIGEEESLRFILNHYKPRHGWNAFLRIRLALTLGSLPTTWQFYELPTSM